MRRGAVPHPVEHLSARREESEWRRRDKLPEVDSRRPQELLELLRKRSPQTGRELYEKIGISRMHFSKCGRSPVAAGLVVPEGPTSRRVYWAAELKAKADAAASAQRTSWSSALGTRR